MSAVQSSALAGPRSPWLSSETLRTYLGLPTRKAARKWADRHRTEVPAIHLPGERTVFYARADVDRVLQRAHGEALDELRRAS